MFSNQLNIKNLFLEAEKLNKTYNDNYPFPHIVIDDLFDETILDYILKDFSNDLSLNGDEFDNKAEKKISLNNTENLSINTNNFINFLNSNFFIKYLQKLTGIKETLIPDPLLIGGGLHELRNGGFLNIHSDFNRHPKMKLDRRLNILIYLNKNWHDNNGGQLELWDKEMKNCVQKILPTFNKMVIFSTTDFSYHGNPNKVNVNDGASRKSIALYYYSNGRPSSERKLGLHSTIFRKRPGSEDVDGNLEYKKIFGKIYLKKKKSF